jgi:gluconolactonase
MFNPFAPVERVPAQVWSRMPDRFRLRRASAWADANRGGEVLDCFLEGPSFDRQGRLWVVDIPFGRIFRIDAGGNWELAAEYDGWPNGLKFHRDGRAFICDYRRGLLRLDVDTGAVTPVLETVNSEGFKGLNDLHFAGNGDLYFTDQGQTGIADPSGRLYCLRADGRLDRLLANVPSPNGVTLSPNGRTCYVAATRSQQVWRVPLMPDGGVAKVGVAIQLSGGFAGPDGIECDSEGGLLVCHLGIGVWRFDARMLPTHLVEPAAGEAFVTNLAFGPRDARDVYLTGSTTGTVQVARLPVPGRSLFAHSPALGPLPPENMTQETNDA